MSSQRPRWPWPQRDRELHDLEFHDPLLKRDEIARLMDLSLSTIVSRIRVLWPGYRRNTLMVAAAPEPASDPGQPRGI